MRPIAQQESCELFGFPVHVKIICLHLTVVKYVYRGICLRKNVHALIKNT